MKGDQMAWSTTAVSVETRNPLPPRRPNRRIAVGCTVVLVIALIAAGAIWAGAIWLRTQQGKLEVSQPTWDCTGTRLVPRESFGADEQTEDPGPDAQLAPQLVPDMACWASWSVANHAVVPVDVQWLQLPFGGPETGAAFRITAARINGRDVTIGPPPWRREADPGPPLDVRVPVASRLPQRGQMTVSVFVEFGEGCSGEGWSLTLWPTIRTSSFGVPRTTSYNNQDDTGRPRSGLTVRGTRYSDCSE